MTLNIRVEINELARLQTFLQKFIIFKLEQLAIWNFYSPYETLSHLTFESIASNFYQNWTDC